MLEPNSTELYSYISLYGNQGHFLFFTDMTHIANAGGVERIVLERKKAKLILIQYGSQNQHTPDFFVTCILPVGPLVYRTKLHS